MSQLTLNSTVTALLNPLILKSDKARVENCIFDSTFAQSIIDTLGAFVTPQEVEGMKQKGRVHTVRVARWIASSGLDRSKFDRASAFCAAVIASSAQPRVSFKDLHYVCGATGEGTALIAGVSRAKLRAVITGMSTNAGTIATQVSRSVGKGGLFSGMGIVCKPDEHGFSVTPNGRAHPFLIAYAHTLNGLSDRSIIEMMEGAE